MSVNHIKENFRLKTNRGNHERLIAFTLWIPIHRELTYNN